MNKGNQLPVDNDMEQLALRKRLDKGIAGHVLRHDESRSFSFSMSLRPLCMVPVYHPHFTTRPRARQILVAAKTWSIWPPLLQRRRIIPSLRVCTTPFSVLCRFFCLALLFCCSLTMFYSHEGELLSSSPKQAKLTEQS